MTRIRRNKHYTFGEKKLALEAFLWTDEYKNLSLEKFSNVCGISYGSLWNWGTAIGWDASRIEELKKRRQKKSEKKSGMGEEVEEKILELKGENVDWGPLKIKQYLWRHEQILVPQTSIYKFLKERGLVKERKKREGEPSHDRKFEYESPLAGVQMDLMHVTLSNRQTIYLVTLLDDYSRFVLVSRFIAVKTMTQVTEVFRDAVRQYGVMDNLLTDCGSEFVSWQKVTDFEDLLVKLDVNFIASGPDKKENQGKVERWHQTVREGLRSHGPLDYSSEAQIWIDALVNRYNYERPHQGIGGLVPADRYFGMREEIEEELERYRAGQRTDQQIYLVCRAGGRKLVISGQRPANVEVHLDGEKIKERND